MHKDDVHVDSLRIPLGTWEISQHAHEGLTQNALPIPFRTSESSHLDWNTCLIPFCTSASSQQTVLSSMVWICSHTTEEQFQFADSFFVNSVSLPSNSRQGDSVRRRPYRWQSIVPVLLPWARMCKLTVSYVVTHLMWLLSRRKQVCSTSQFAASLCIWYNCCPERQTYVQLCTRTGNPQSEVFSDATHSENTSCNSGKRPPLHEKTKPTHCT